MLRRREGRDPDLGACRGTGRPEASGQRDRVGDIAALADTATGGFARARDPDGMRTTQRAGGEGRPAAGCGNAPQFLAPSKWLEPPPQVPPGSLTESGRQRPCQRHLNCLGLVSKDQ